MKGNIEGKENERGKRKGERNEGAINDTSLDVRQRDDQNSSKQEGKERGRGTKERSTTLP